MLLNKLVRMLVFLAAAGLTACDYVETTHFLSEPSQAANDPRLPGTWIATQVTLNTSGGEASDSDERVMILTVDRSTDQDGRKLLDISLIGVSREKGEQPEFDWLLTHGHTTRIGDRTFINLQTADSYEIKAGAPLTEATERRQGEYAPQIIEYRIDDKDRLYISLMNADYVASAIAAGTVAGTVEKRDYSIYVKLTATPEALARFIAEAPADKLFDDPGGYFVRGGKGAAQDPTPP